MDVFLSYSWKDRQIAKRMYDDLKNSGVKIWRDQIDGEPIADFKEEFLQKIGECQYFILLDSPNYRSVHKSKSEHWCLEEVKRCLENQKHSKSPQIIVCLLEKDGDWRKQFPYEDFRIAFEKVNALKFIDLCYSGYDNSGVYDQAMDVICTLLKTDYLCRNNAIPTMRDLEDELKGEYGGNQQLQKVKLDDATEEIVFKGYEVIYSKTLRHYPNVSDSFKIWLEDCCHCGAHLFFPRWTYAVWLANQPRYDVEEVCHCFESLVNDYPSDPRGYRGLGNALFRKAEQLSDKNNSKGAVACYNESLRILLKTEAMLLLPKNQHQKKYSMFGVLCNIGMTQFALRQYEQALDYWERALLLLRNEGGFNDDLVENIFIVRCILQHDCHSILEWLQSLRETYPLEPVIYKRIGCCYAKLQSRSMAISMMEKAYDLQPDMENLFLLSMWKKQTGTISASDFSKWKEMVDAYECMCENDEYWMKKIREEIL